MNGTYTPQLFGSHINLWYTHSASSREAGQEKVTKSVQTNAAPRKQCGRPRLPLDDSDIRKCKESKSRKLGRQGWKLCGLGTKGQFLSVFSEQFPGS